MDVLGRLLPEKNCIDFAEVKEHFRVNISLFALIARKLSRELVILHDKKFKLFLPLSAFILYLFGHPVFPRPVIDPLNLGKFFTTELNEFFRLLIRGMDARAAVGNIDENVFGECVVFFLKGSKSVE